MRIRSATSLLALVILTSGCGITAIRPYVSKRPNSPQPPRLSSLTVAVVGESQRDVETARVALESTGLFGAVVVEPYTYADMIATVAASSHGIRCGTPQNLTYFTLGLFPTGNAYRASMKLELTAEGADQPLVIEREIFAHTKHGLWALFLRANKKWSRPKWDNDPAQLSAAIRDELLRSEEAIMLLAGRRAT